MSPMNKSHFIINCAYQVFTTLSYIVLGLTFKYEWWEQAIWPFSVLLMYRQQIRLLDLEDTFFDPKDPFSTKRYSFGYTGMLIVL